MESAYELAPQRSATQIDLPSRSISIALVDPHVRPTGIFAQSFTVPYGFGNELVGFRSACACANATNTRVIASVHKERTVIMSPHFERGQIVPLVKLSGLCLFLSTISALHAGYMATKGTKRTTEISYFPSVLFVFLWRNSL